MTGVRRPLTLLKQDPDDVTARGSRVIDADIAQRCADRCSDRVTGPGGTATLAQVPGFSVGGKTGTVHKVGEGGYLDDQYVALFVGIAPMNAPRYVTAILIDQPRGDHYGGGLAAAPVYSRITEEVLRIRNAQPDSIGTLGSRLDGPPAEVRNTTPDCITLHRQLRVWRDAGVDYVAMEASSHALDQRRLDGLKIDVAVFTNLSRDHLDYHPSMEAYGESKLKLFRDFASSVQIYNADDSFLSSQTDTWGRDSIGISFSDESADVLIGMISVVPLVFTLRTPWGDAQIDSLLAGRFNAFNLTVAIVAAVSMGVPFIEIIAASQQLKPVPGRLEPVEMATDITVVVDYAHTPDALHRAIMAVSEAQRQGCVWVVFGCGGDRDRGKRSEMGAVAARLADRIVVTSDNPRGEPPEGIIQDILAGCGDVTPLVEVDRATAISLVIAKAAAGDTILIAGKGHETYQEIAGARIPFSDVQCANHYLAQRRAA